MHSSMRIEKDVPMEMRDGVVLRADVYRPDDNEKHPAILFRSGYNKTQSVPRRDFMSPVDMILAGYAIVIQDIRGRFASDGDWGGGYNVEFKDGYDSVEVLAAEPWCDGNIGTAGGSYLANLQWITAIENPPHLKAIAPWIGRSGMYLREDTQLAGVMLMFLDMQWTALMAVDVVDRLEKQGKDVAQARQMARQVLFNPEEAWYFLPLKDVPHFKFEGLQAIWASMLQQANPTPEIAGDWPYNKINVPCLNVGGWYDVNIYGTFRNFLGMREQGGTELARQGQHVVVGPWAHGAILGNYLGGIHFGTTAAGEAAGVTATHIAFYNKYLRGMDVSLPAVRYFVMGKDRWQTADTWPPPQAQWVRFFLLSRGQANTTGGDGLLGRDEPGAESPDVFVYNPAFPVPTTGGHYTAAGLAPGPAEQGAVEKRNDVLCYTTPVLEEDIEITGPLELHLFAATSARDTDFTAKLVDVYPGGRAYNIADGIIRARYRKSVAQPELVNPGEVNEYVINMRNTSCMFRKGHRIRIDISSSDFPRWDRNMNTGNLIGEDAQGIPAMQTIYHQPGYASYIDLPVIPSRST